MMSEPGTGMLWQAADDAISERAAEFFARRRCEPWSEADQAELDAWLAQSTSHYVAYLRVEGIAARGDHLAALNALELKRGAPADAYKFTFPRLVLPLLAAASVALAAVLGGPFVAYLMQPPDSIDSTDVGGRTLLSYADQTQIELNTSTSVRVRMTSAERTVWLEKGEAWFHVSHDAKHPFTVVAGRHRVTDLGTDFLVRRDANDVSVTLLNGRVTLSGVGAQTATLSPGDEAIATAASLSVTRKTPQELDDEQAWRRGMLAFRNTPLSEVVREFNRYNAIRLVIADPKIAGVRITASLRTSDYESFLQIAQATLNLRVDRKGNEILISRMQRDETKKAARAKRRP